MDARRILVANELTSYRQTIAIVFRELHPGVEIVEIDPEILDEEVARRVPDLVVCSRVTAVVTICVGGEHTAVRDIELADLLSVCARVL
jgi:hypothetical protein